MTQALKTLKPKDIASELGEWLREVNEEDRVFTKNKKIEVIFIVEPVNAILPRTEGVEDITLIRLPGTEYEVPVILPEKLQAVTRRRMLAYLRNYRDKRKDMLRKYLEKLASLYRIKKEKGGYDHVGFITAEDFLKDEEWNCYIQPPGGDVRRATDVGMDGFCPACTLFGTVIDGSKVKGIGNESIGVKSRVEFDPAIAISDRSISVVGYTHSKVSDGVSWTGRSLYKEFHVLPGTIFVGKVTLEDVTEPELKAFLATLSAVDKLGGRERVFGGVRIHLVGVRGGSYETVSALELVIQLAREYGKKLPTVTEVVEKLKPILSDKGFITVDSEEYKRLLDNMETWDKLWESTVEYDKQLIERVLLLLRGKGKYEEA